MILVICGRAFSGTRFWSTFDILTRAVLPLLMVLALQRQVIGQSRNETLPANVDCQQLLLAEVYICVSKHNIDFNFFLVMVSDNKETGNATITRPANSSTTTMTREQICGPRQEVMSCILTAAQTMISGQACVPKNQSANKEDVILNDQRFLIKEQLEAIVGAYDVFCAHPCRLSLLDDMRACYTKNNLNPQLFISTEASGPVIGSTQLEVEQFCKNSDSIYSCLQKSRDDCQESQVVLTSIGLDLDLMNKGFQVLCGDTQSYMKSLDCFDSHTKEVENCSSVKYRAILAMAVSARKENWSEDTYYQEVCGVILNHITCDLNAWAAKEDKDCNEDTLDLKRKLHCTLMPDRCRSTHNSTAATVCTFKLKSASSRHVTHWIYIFIFVMSVQSLKHFVSVY